MSDERRPNAVYIRLLQPGEELSQSGPSVASDADDPNLAEIRRRAVEPVFRGILRDGEDLESLRVHWLENFDDGYVQVVGAIRGESYRQNLWMDRCPADTGPLSLEQVENAADQLAGLLEDWVCETRFGWGQQRIADYELPDAQLDGE